MSSTPRTGALPRSCTSCNHRKVKCNKQQPCYNCIKAGNATSCSYPPGNGRAAKRSRQHPGPELIERLSRLESIIQRLKHPDPSTGTSPPGLSASTAPSTSGATSPQSYSVDKHIGRLIIDETRSYYVSNVLWASLSNEIEELRDMLTESVYEDQNEDFVSDHAALLRSNAALLGFQGQVHSLLPYHPSLPQSVALLNIFTENVLPLVRIFHMPSTVQSFWDAIASLDSLDRNKEALLFAIYYSAVISMEDPEQCNSILGVSREIALERYRSATEQAMGRANLLNTQNIVLLQAAVLFLSALRNEDDSRTTWSLTSLVYHIAQAMGLHRDGTVFNLTPLETEVRRRLWYHICLLDSRSSEYHGYEPVVNEHGFDTRLPLHINDSDLTADMATPPPERDEACEMTFCLIRCEVMRTAWKVKQMPLWAPGRQSDVLNLAERQALVADLKSRLHKRYLRHCEKSSDPFLRVSLVVARIILARTWLAVNYTCSRDLINDDSGIREQLFLTSIEVLELSAQLMTDRNMSRWTWHSKTHIQWHAVFFVLSEICARPPGPDCDRAWKHVCTMHDSWRMKERGRNGTLWRPIKRLMAKARYVREIQKADPRTPSRHPIASPGPDFNMTQEPTFSFTPNDDEAVSDPATATANTSWGLSIDNVQNVLGMEFLDPLTHLFPDGPQMDMFGSTIQGANKEFDHDGINTWSSEDTWDNNFE